MELAYLAGFFDGEGSVGYYRNCARLTVTNTDPRAVVLFRDSFGAGTLSLGSMKNKPRSRQQYRWVVFGENALCVAEELLPLLKEKAAQVRLLLSTRGLPPGDPKKSSIAAEISRLKKLRHDGMESF